MTREQELFLDAARTWPLRNINRASKKKRKQAQNRVDRQVVTEQARLRQEDFATSADRRAIRKGRFIESINRLEVWERDRGVCGICGKWVDFDKFTIDHIIPFSRGGWHCYNNVQIAHGRCNNRKGSSMPWEFVKPRTNKKSKGYIHRGYGLASSRG
jgi:5-methylcytosine-specific restriction endonuclease McrA